MVQSSAQRPTYMGYMGVKEAIDVLEGKEIEFNTAIESYSITKDNIDDYDLDAWDTLDEEDADAADDADATETTDDADAEAEPTEEAAE